MGIYSSGNKWRTRAKGAEAQAVELTNRQSDIDFGRQLLANIRQQRLQIAQARFQNVLAAETTSSSSARGAEAEINSTLAGEVGYAYDTSKRLQQISGLQQLANNYYKKYQKQQKTRSNAIQATAIVAGALAGGALGIYGLGVGALQGAGLGANIGHGIGKAALGDFSGAAQSFTSAAVSYQLGAAGTGGNLSAGKQDLISSGVLSGGTVGTSGGKTFIDLSKGVTSYGDNVRMLSGMYKY